MSGVFRNDNTILRDDRPIDASQQEKVSISDPGLFTPVLDPNYVDAKMQTGVL